MKFIFDPRIGLLDRILNQILIGYSMGDMHLMQF
jgi:hypothetical protein